MGDNKIKRIAVSGATGFVGTYLSERFADRGYEISHITRQHFIDEAKAALISEVDKADVIINLAGAPINHRWTDSYKKELYDSRMATTRRLVEAIAAAESKPRVFFSTSAVGYYSSQGCNTENDYTPAEGFLADLCRAWEQEAEKAQPFVRTVIMRFGVVMGSAGGVLPTLSVPASFKIAPVLGSGKQLFPWIDIEDIAGAVSFLMRQEELSGPFNFVSPTMVTNREFTRSLASHKHTWLTMKVPALIFRAVMGEASSFVLTGQCVVPRKLLQAGYKFVSPDPDSFFGKPED